MTSRAIHRSLPRFVIHALTISAVTASLTACFPIVLGAAAGSAVVATDRRTPGTQLEDETIELRANNRIRENLGERVHINVTSFNRQVLVTGEAPTAQDKARVEQAINTVENVKSVVNEVAIGAVTTLSERSNDTFITGKVKASLVDAKDLTINSFKVVTERGVVYLMGRVTQREAQRATDITRGVGGVLKVVRVFEVLTEQELAGLAAAQR